MCRLSSVSNRVSNRLRLIVSSVSSVVDGGSSGGSSDRRRRRPGSCSLFRQLLCFADRLIWTHSEENPERRRTSDGRTEGRKCDDDYDG